MDHDVADVVRLSAEANVALVRGDIDGYLSRIVHASDYTLMSVFRRVSDGWELAHRHADPLGPRITVEQAAALARGELS